MVQFFKKSAASYVATIEGIDPSLTVAKAYLSIQDAEDSSTALVTATATGGDLVNTSGKVVATFGFTATAFDSVSPGEYVMGIKLILSDGSPVMVAESLQTIAVRPAFIAAVT